MEGARLVGLPIGYQQALLDDRGDRVLAGGGRRPQRPRHVRGRGHRGVRGPRLRRRRGPRRDRRGARHQHGVLAAGRRLSDLLAGAEPGRPAAPRPPVASPRRGPGRGPATGRSCSSCRPTTKRRRWRVVAPGPGDRVRPPGRLPRHRRRLHRRHRATGRAAGATSCRSTRTAAWAPPCARAGRRPLDRAPARWPSATPTASTPPRSSARSSRRSSPARPTTWSGSRFAGATAHAPPPLVRQPRADRPRSRGSPAAHRRPERLPGPVGRRRPPPPRSSTTTTTPRCSPSTCWPRASGTPRSRSPTASARSGGRSCAWSLPAPGRPRRLAGAEPGLTVPFCDQPCLT